MPGRTFVLARNHREFLDWCRENNRSPHEQGLVYVHEVRQVRGVRLTADDAVVRYERYYEHPDGIELSEELRRLEQIGTKEDGRE
jgi:hypothetical protein